jgi:hypothetical protein
LREPTATQTATTEKETRKLIKRTTTFSAKREEDGFLIESNGVPLQQIKVYGVPADITRPLAECLIYHGIVRAARIGSKFVIQDIPVIVGGGSERNDGGVEEGIEFVP